MKRSILLALMMLPIMAMAQIPQFTKVVDKYSSNEGITAMTIDRNMIAMFAGENAAFDYVDEVQILLCEDEATAGKIVKDAKKAVKKSKVEELVIVNDEDGTYSIYTKKQDGQYKNFIVIIENDTPSGFIVISGSVPEEKLNEVIKLVDM